MTTRRQKLTNDRNRIKTLRTSGQKPVMDAGLQLVIYLRSLI